MRRLSIKKKVTDSSSTKHSSIEDTVYTHQPTPTAFEPLTHAPTPTDFHDPFLLTYQPTPSTFLETYQPTPTTFLETNNPTPSTFEIDQSLYTRNPTPSTFSVNQPTLKPTSFHNEESSSSSLFIAVVTLAAFALLVLIAVVYVCFQNQSKLQTISDNQETTPLIGGNSTSNGTEAIAKMRTSLEAGRPKQLHTNKGTKQIQLSLQESTLRWSVSDSQNSKVYSVSLDKFASIFKGESSPSLPSRPLINPALVISLIPRDPTHSPLHFQFPDPQEREVVYAGLSEIVQANNGSP